MRAHIEIVLRRENRRPPRGVARDRRKALNEPRRDRRRAVDACRAREDHVGAAERLGEIVRTQADAPFRQVEAQVLAHRAAQPRVRLRLWRPGSFHQAAEHDAIDELQARFQESEDVNANVGARALAHDAIRQRGGKQFGIILWRNRQRLRGHAVRHLVERLHQRGAVRTDALVG